MKNLKQIITVAVMAVFMLGSFSVVAQEIIFNPNDPGNSTTFDQVGLDHNKYLKEVLLKFDKTTTKTNVISQTKNIISKTFPKSIGNSFYEFETYDDPFKMLQELVNKKLISIELFSLTSQALKEVSKYGINSREIEVFVNLKRNSKISLSKEETFRYMSFLSVMKHSSKFWDSNVENGNKYLSKTRSSNTTMSRVNWWKVLAVDCIGGMVGGPAGYIAASAIAVIMQL